MTGEIFGKNRNPRISVVVPKELLSKAKNHAKEVKMPLSMLMRIALGEYLYRNETANIDTVLQELSDE